MPNILTAVAASQRCPTPAEAWSHLGASAEVLLYINTRARFTEDQLCKHQASLANTKIFALETLQSVDWIVAFYKQQSFNGNHKKFCLWLNRFDTYNDPCAKKNCLLEHQCMLCGSDEHGAFFSANNQLAYACPFHRRYDEQLGKLGKLWQINSNQVESLVEELVIFRRSISSTPDPTEESSRAALSRWRSAGATQAASVQATAAQAPAKPKRPTSVVVQPVADGIDQESFSTRVVDVADLCDALQLEHHLPLGFQLYADRLTPCA